MSGIWRCATWTMESKEGLSRGPIDIPPFLLASSTATPNNANNHDFSTIRGLTSSKAHMCLLHRFVTCSFSINASLLLL